MRTARRGQRSPLASRVASSLAIALCLSTAAAAHDPGLSALDLRIEANGIVAVLSLAGPDAESLRASTVLGRESIRIEQDGRILEPSATSTSIDVNGGVHLRLTYPPPQGSRLTIASRIIQALPRGHRQLVSIRTAGGVLLAERMLDAESRRVSTDLSTVDGTSSFRRFLGLGVQHILTGYDHLLFLAGVLVVLRKWRDVIQTITAFTVAHSVTLAFATAGLVAVPSRIVEPLIAASIVYVGIENLIRPAHGSRWKLTFAFGLVHGLGFASALRDVGVGTTSMSIALPLASFNAGVEAGQIAVAALIVPVFWYATARQARLATAWSLLVVAAGSWWVLARTVWS